MDQVKQRIGQRAATLVDDGMLIGLGTGSTANYFIQALSERVRNEGLVIATVSSSYSSEKLARDLNLPFVSIDAISEIDITFDGADEIDPEKRMIKGRGGALLKEKILAAHSKEFIILVDESKCVTHLGSTCLLPVEVAQFGYHLTEKALEKFASEITLRMRGDGKPFLTENGHFILDLALKMPIANYELLEIELQAIAGVLETGFFFNTNRAGKVIVGYQDGSIQLLA
jgi:ribose 5-phosphate isomerase A